jgi:hypothetical protein
VEEEKEGYIVAGTGQSGQDGKGFLTNPGRDIASHIQLLEKMIREFPVNR